MRTQFTCPTTRRLVRRQYTAARNFDYLFACQIEDMSQRLHAKYVQVWRPTLQFFDEDNVPSMIARSIAWHGPRPPIATPKSPFAAYFASRHKKNIHQNHYLPSPNTIAD